MKVMFLGDVHGNLNAGRLAIKNAQENQVERIIWCGDCGLWPGLDGIDFLDEVNFFSRRANIFNYWVGGNHEWWDEWIRVVRAAPKSADNFSHIRSHILLAPRLHKWKWDGKQFVSAAGAVSIDRQWRTEGRSWWPQEILSEEEVVGGEKMFSNYNVDYFISHDASNYTSWKARIKPDPSSMEHRRKIDRLLTAARPDMHFHGHFHTRYEWENTITNPNVLTKTIGLECDGDEDNWGILDTSDNSFYWRGVEKSVL